MTQLELKQALRPILTAEEQPDTDWKLIEALCLALIARLNSETEPAYPHDVVYHYLDDTDIRQGDAAYAQKQRDRLREWLG